MKYGQYAVRTDSGVNCDSEVTILYIELLFRDE